MIKENLHLIPFLLVVIANLPLYYLIYKKQIHLNIATFLLWILIDSIVILTTFFSGGEVAYTSYGFVLCDSLTMLLILNTKIWKWEKKETLVLILVVLGIILWQLTNAFYGLIFITILKYFIAGFPTLVDSYKRPEKGQSFFWLVITLSIFINILIIQNTVIQSYIFLYTGFIFNLLFGLLNLRSR